MSIVTRVVNDLRWEAERNGITLNAPAGAAANAQVDENKIEQVITNIVINAIKFSGPGGRVEVGVVGKETAVEIVVRDQGIGIAREHHATIFRRFHRLDSSSTVEGSGLGLAVAKEYVERHGGHITLTSEPGKGSAFTVTLPIHHRRGQGR
jgi:signal transduction histidine kinase